MFKKIHLTVGVVLAFAFGGNAHVPKYINYQGLLTDASGNALTGNYTVNFRIYDAPTEGSLLWGPQAYTVQAEDGIFSVALGPIEYTVFNGDERWLSLQVGNDPEMTPRKRLLSVAYSFRSHVAQDADKLDGRDASAFVQKVDGVPSNATGDVDLVAGNNVTITPDVAKSQITISAAASGGGDNMGNHTATQNIKLSGHWLSGDGSDEGIYITNGGNIGVGITNPDAKLKVGEVSTSSRQIAACDWVDLSSNGKGIGILGGNLYTRRSDNTYRYSRTHDSIGAIGFAVNYPWNQASVITSGTTQSTADDAFAPRVVATFTRTGNVGIGTNTPNTKLDVREGDIKIEYGGSPRLNLYSRGNGTQKYSIRATNDDDGAGGQRFVIRNESFGSDVLTITGGTGATSDRVGIGTNTPDTRLDVRDGDIKIEYGGSPRLYLHSRGNGTQKYSIRATNANDGAGGQRFVIRNESFGSDVLTITGGGSATSDRVGIGTANPQEKLTVRGNILVQSENGANVVKIGAGLDYAEGFNVSYKERINTGSVLIIDPDNPGKLTVSNQPYDSKVAGIVAGAKGLGSGVRLGVDRFDFDVALAGRVYCNVDASEAGVNPGDLLTTSATPGHAMKATNYEQAQGAILGKAMQKLEKGQKGQILVLVTVQ